ncbi:hypothetical protein TWF281_003748 [Arthrobotrys megalospora]
MIYYSDWPLDRFPSERDLLGAPWPTAMESLTETFSAGIRRNIALSKLHEQLVALETDFELVEIERSPEGQRLEILNNLTSDSQYMDLICIVGGYSRRQGILCHRLFVAKQSPFIAASLENHTFGVQLPAEIELPWRVTADSFNKVLEWCYRATRPTIKDSFEQLAQLFVAARVLEMPALEKITMELLKKKDFAPEFTFDMTRVDGNDSTDRAKHLVEQKALRHFQGLNVIYSEMRTGGNDKEDFALLVVKSIDAVGKGVYANLYSGWLASGFVNRDLQRAIGFGLALESD